MDAKVREYTEAKVKELIGAYSCCAEAKAAGQAWLDAAGTDQEAEKTKALIAELEEDIIPIDGLIAFAGSEGGAKVFGAEKAKENIADYKPVMTKEEYLAFMDSMQTTEVVEPTPLPIVGQ